MQAIELEIASLPAVERESFPDYVLAEIARASGPQPLCPGAREILLSFWDRLGPEDAMAVCSRAFVRHGGYWHGAPVTPLRFQPSHHAFFAAPLLAGEIDG